jgi:hypothetical protein
VASLLSLKGRRDAQGLPEFHQIGAALVLHEYCVFSHALTLRDWAYREGQVETAEDLVRALEGAAPSPGPRS